eukprot:7522804-Pyramimonas_sp.AAC.1
MGERHESLPEPAQPPAPAVNRRNFIVQVSGAAAAKPCRSGPVPEPTPAPAPEYMPEPKRRRCHKNVVGVCADDPFLQA